MIVDDDNFFSSSLTDDEEVINNCLRKKYNPRAEKPKIYKDVHCEKSLFYLSKKNCFRKGCAYIASHRYFEGVIIFLIISGSLKLVVETYKDDTWPTWIDTLFYWIDIVFNVLFNLEMMIKIVRNGFLWCEGSYLTDPWSMLDFFIVVSADFDLIFSGVDLSFLKVVRMLRTLRPLRFISHNKSMKIVVNALLGSVPALINVIIVILMVWIMFAILAISFMTGKMGYCKSPKVTDIYGVSITECDDLGGTWTSVYWNFDNIIESLVTLYILSSQEGWPNIMASALDSNDKIYGPSYNESMYMAVYFIVFIMVSSLFLMNLFVGVLFFQFAAEQKKEVEGKYDGLDDE